MFLSIVIPAYNEEENILKTIEELLLIVKQCTVITKTELLVIDDHSSDSTYTLIENLKDENIHCLRLSKRSGSHTALRAGISIAQGDAALCISADGQDNPSILNEMLNKFAEDNHIVWAVRSNREEPFFQKMFARVFYKILHSLVPQSSMVNLANADFYLISKRVIDAINKCDERNTSLFGLLIWLGFKQDSVKYKRRDRYSGSSKWNFKSRVNLAKDWIIAFSGIPLRFITYLGITYASLGFLYSIFLIIYSLLGYAAPGWSENVILLLIGDGVNMIMIGIIGEYLWRVLDETRKRPIFLFEKETKKNKPH